MVLGKTRLEDAHPQRGDNNWCAEVALGLPVFNEKGPPKDDMSKLQIGGFSFKGTQEMIEKDNKCMDLAESIMKTHPDWGKHKDDLGKLFTKLKMWRGVQPAKPTPTSIAEARSRWLASVESGRVITFDEVMRNVLEVSDVNGEECGGGMAAEKKPTLDPVTDSKDALTNPQHVLHQYYNDGDRTKAVKTENQRRHEKEFWVRSCIVYHAPCNMHHVSSVMYHVSCIMHHVPCTTCTMHHN